MISIFGLKIKNKFLSKINVSLLDSIAKSLTYQYYQLSYKN